jgi:hypothetical protein
MGKVKDMYTEFEFVRDHLELISSQELDRLRHQISIELMERDVELQARIDLDEREAVFVRNGELSA